VLEGGEEGRTPSQPYWEVKASRVKESVDDFVAMIKMLGITFSVRYSIFKQKLWILILVLELWQRMARLYMNYFRATLYM